MNIENPIALLGLLKGAPLSCLIALRIAGQPVGAEYLCRATRYSDKPVSQALEYLRELGIACQTGRNNSWQLAGEYSQLPLGYFELLEDGENNSSRKISDSNATTTTLNTQKKKSLEKSSSSSKSSRKISDSTLYNLLREAGIGEPKRSRLCELEWVTVDYARAHIERAKQTGDDIGLLIWRMEQHDPAPEEQDDPNDYQRYIKSAFADFIEH